MENNGAQTHNEHEAADNNTGGSSRRRRSNGARPAASRNSQPRRQTRRYPDGIPGIRVRTFIRDNMHPEFRWLLPGWLAEERLMDTGRVYRYYYDPDGNFYHTRDQVLQAWEEAGLIVLDLDD